MPAMAAPPRPAARSRIARLCRAGAVAAASTLLAACSTLQYPVNAPLAKVDPNAGYRLQNLSRRAGGEELLVILTFSGGGSRAAALSYGVLEELSRQRIRWHGRDERLLDEVDLVYGVSGGAITAAAFSLKGDGIFDDFLPQFLERNLQEQLVDDVFSLTGLWRLNAPRYGRGEMLSERLDEAVFHGATFAELDRQRRGPFAVISATDMTIGARFDFTQEYFDLLCSDLGRFPVARAVAASSDVPLLFTPITLKNYAGSCGRPTTFEGLVATAGGSPSERRRRQQLVDDARTYQDAKRRPYVHLLDGGLADNLALRSLLDAEAFTGGPREFARALHLERVRKVLLVVVDAANDETYETDASGDVPPASRVASAVADIPIKRMSRETRLLLQDALASTRASLEQAGEHPPELYFVDVSLAAEKDAARRAALLATPTTLFLRKDDVRALRESGAQQVRDSADLRKLVQVLR
jgi:NTE family protein